MGLQMRQPQLHGHILCGVQRTLGIEQRQQTLGPRAVARFCQAQRLVRLRQLLGLRLRLRLHTADGMQRQLDIGKRLNDGFAVRGQQFFALGHGQFIACRQPARIKNRRCQTGCQCIQRVVKNALPALVPRSHTARQRQAGQHGGTGHLYVGLGCGQLRLSPRNVWAAHQQLGWHTRPHGRHLQPQQAGGDHLGPSRLPQQRGQRGLRIQCLLLQCQQTAALAGHQALLLRQLQRRRGPGTRSGFHQLHQPLSALQIQPGNIHPFMQSHAVQPRLGGTCGDRQLHGVAVKHAGFPDGLGGITACTVLSPEVHLIAG